MDDFKHKGIFIIRYGISIALILLLIMIWILMNGIRIGQSTEVDLIQQQPFSYIALIRSGKDYSLNIGDTIQIRINDTLLKFRNLGTNERSGYIEVSPLEPLPSLLADKPFLEGTITGKEASLWRIIFTWRIGKI